MTARSKTATTTGIAVWSRGGAGLPHARCVQDLAVALSRVASGLRYLWQAMVGGLSIQGRVCTQAGFLEVGRGH